MVLTVITSIMEAISIGAVMPFLSALTSPDILLKNEYTLMFSDWLSLDSEQLLPLFTITFAVLVLISGGMRIMLLWIQTRLGFAIGVDMDMDIYSKTLYKPYSEHLICNSSEIIAGLTTKTSQVVTQFIISVLIIFSSILILIAIMVLLISINPIVAILSIAGFGSIYGVVFIIVRKHLRFASKEASVHQNKVIKILQESLGGVRDIIINNSQKVYYESYFHTDLSLRRAQGNNQIIANTPRFGIESIAMVLIVLMAYVLFDDDVGIMESIPLLGVIALGAQRLLPVLQQIFSSFSLIRGVGHTTEDVIMLLDQAVHNYSYKQKLQNIHFEDSIELRNVSFRYSTSEPLVFQNINLRVSKGERIGIIGTTGSGKSTLLDLLMGLLSPTKGEFIVDGETLKLEQYQSWQEHIAHVPQTIYLSDSTVSENIAFGVSSNNIDHSLVRQVAKDAQISKSIESWEDQYKTIVGENGIRLSGGQRQRIGIARALYKKSDVIIFDEATSALDTKTEASIMKVIDNIDSNITIFIIAHRLTTLKGCDRVIDLDKEMHPTSES